MVAPILALYVLPYALGRQHERRYQLQTLKPISKHGTLPLQLVDHLLSLIVVLPMQKGHDVAKRRLRQIDHLLYEPNNKST